MSSSVFKQLARLRVAPLAFLVTAVIVGCLDLAFAVYAIRRWRRKQLTHSRDAEVGIELADRLPKAQGAAAAQISKAASRGHMSLRYIVLLCILVYSHAAPALYFAFNLAEFPGAAEKCCLDIPHEISQYRSFWFLRFHIGNGSGMPVNMMFFGGNGDQLLFSARRASALVSELRHANITNPFFVSVLAYRGYPPSAGWASQSTITSDALALLEILTTNTSRVLVAGTSMGAAVAAQLTLSSPERVLGLLMHSPFTSFWAAAFAVLPPVTYLLSPWIWLADHWDSKHALQSLPTDIPVLVLSSDADELIPPLQHYEVFHAATSTQKLFNAIPGTSHSMFHEAVAESRVQLNTWARAALRRVESGILF